MKFRNYLETITGVEIYPLVSLLIFFAFFMVLLWFVFRTKKHELDSVKNIPLN